MKKYHYPLMTSGLLLILLGQQPLWAVENSHSFLEEEEKSHQPEIDKIVLPKISSLLPEWPDLPRDEETPTFFREGLEPLATTETTLTHSFTESLEQEEAIASKDLFIAQMPPTYAPPPGQTFPGAAPIPPTYAPPPGQTFPGAAPNPPVQGTPNQDVLVPNPDVIIRSNGTSIPDSLQPTMPVAPTLPRAIAPPVGDMAISNIDASGSEVDLGSSAIVPRLVLRQAPAREVLAVLARFAGLNLVFTDTPSAGAQAADAGMEATVSLDLENEPVQDVFNSVLMVSGLQANRRGRTIFVGSRLPQGARTLVSRTLRLNQVKSDSAGVFLASQGAEVQRLVTTTEDVIDPQTGNRIGRRESAPELDILTADDSVGQQLALAPKLLRGLAVSTDVRLNTVTLVGEPRTVQVATSLLTQMDARRRQVAVNVKVVDVNLTNDQSFSSSFSFGSGDAFIVQDEGAAVLRFGGFSPARGTDVNNDRGRVINPPVVDNPLSNANTFLDFNNSVVIPGAGGRRIVDVIQLGPNIPPQAVFSEQTDATFFGRVPGISMDPGRVGITDFEFGGDDSLEIEPIFATIPDPEGGVGDTIDVFLGFGSTIVPGLLPSATSELPSFFQYPKRFLAQIETTIQSGNAKILTDPTLVVQEGQEATVDLTQKVVESVNTQVDPLSGVRTTTPILEDAGLKVTVNVDKIDDNGYISVTVGAEISAPGAQEEFNSGIGSSNILTLLNRRTITSGLIRLRDGQTLILSGIITETDQSITNKVPLLGDIPLLGALFRSQTDSSDRTEVIVLLTPQILHDNGQWGYNYQPGRGTAEVLRDQGFPVQLVP
ncbi:MAG: hypothetical protein AB4062_03810 [Crocosphaera sp.]